jgi:type VI protein secretion system component VasF
MKMSINQEVWLKVMKINSFLKPLREFNEKLTIEMIDLLELRIRLRDQLEYLRIVLTQLYSDRDAYYVLFPLTAHCDEVVKMSILDVQNIEWPPLQQELYKVDDAGDLFYELLDNALIKTDTLSLVYEVYYFCLQDGFCGRNSLDSVRTNYLRKLEKHISIKPIPIQTMQSNLVKRRHFRIPNYSYYCATALLLSLIYYFLTFLASNWQPI